MSSEKKAGAVISLDEAQKLVIAYQEKNPQQPKAFLIDADLIRLLVDQKGCESIRIYNGFDEKAGSETSVIIGVDSNNADMAKGVILDKSVLCPPYHIDGSLIDL